MKIDIEIHGINGRTAGIGADAIREAAEIEAAAWLAKRDTSCLVWDAGADSYSDHGEAEALLADLTDHIRATVCADWTRTDEVSVTASRQA
jgi:hypothetical protein